MPWRHGFRTRAVLRVPPVASVATAPRTWWKITVDRLVSQLRHQRHAAAIGDQLRYRRLRIAEVAEVPGAGRAGLPAGRLAQIGRAPCRESVSVRVDLGGRRIIKKKKIDINTNMT